MMSQDQLKLVQLRPYYQIGDGSDRHTQHYDRSFQNMLNGNNFNANFGAAFFPVPWMIYRRLYLPAFLYSMLLSGILSSIPQEYILMMVPINALIMMFLGDHLYFHATVRKANTGQSLPTKGPTDNFTLMIYMLISVGLTSLALQKQMMAWPLEFVFWGWLYYNQTKK